MFCKSLDAHNNYLYLSFPSPVCLCDDRKNLNDKYTDCYDLIHLNSNINKE